MLNYIIEGLGFIIIGLLVYKFKMVKYLVGYRQTRNYDNIGLAKWAVITCIATGIAIIGSNIILLQLYNITDEFKIIINILILLIGVFNISYGCKKFEVK